MTTRVHLDLELCEGYAFCVSEAPDVFDRRGDTTVVVVEQVSPQRYEDIAAACQACPNEAIWMAAD